MFEVGDRVVCIKPFTRNMYSASTGLYKELEAIPQVGCVYTVNCVHVNHYRYSPYFGEVGLGLQELPSAAPSGKAWIFLGRHFRKVTNIEEPKRRVVEVPKELEPA